MPGLSLGLGLGRRGGGARRDPYAGASLVIDFQAGRYEINGTPFAAADFVTVAGAPVFAADGLVADGDDRLKLPNVAWWRAAEGTFLVDWRLPTPLPAASTVFSLRGGAGSTRTQIDFGVDANSRQGRVTLVAHDGVASRSLLSYPIGFKARPCRALVALKVGEKPRVCGPHPTSGVQSVDGGPLEWFATTSVVSEASLAYRSLFNDTPFAGTIRRVVFWPRRLSDAELLTLYLKGDATNLHLLGDSFVGPTAVDALASALIEERRTISSDGVGGSSLPATAERFALTPQYWSRTLVILDGGFEDTPVSAIAAIDDIAMRGGHGRWLYIQPSPGALAIGSPERAAWDAAQAAIRAHVGDSRYVETLPALQAANNGSAADLSDVAAGLTPRSLRTDSIHETATGIAVRMGLAGQRLMTLGW